MQGGLLVEPGNSVQLAEPLHKLVTGVADGGAMGDSGRRQIGNYSDLAMAEGVAAVYGNVLGQ